MSPSRRPDPNNASQKTSNNSALTFSLLQFLYASFLYAIQSLLQCSLHGLSLGRAPTLDVVTGGVNCRDVWKGVTVMTLDAIRMYWNVGALAANLLT